MLSVTQTNMQQQEVLTAVQSLAVHYNLRIVPPSATRSSLLVLAGKILVFFLFCIKYVLPVFDFFVT